MFKIFQKQIQCFSIQTNRQRLGDFYKMIHPDVLQNAPEKIKEENLKSIKNLNVYLDQLSQNKGCNHQKLGFYVGDKQNKKARKFNYFEVDLHKITENAPEKLLNQHIDKTINSLLGCIIDTKVKSDRFLRSNVRQDTKNKDEQSEQEDAWDQDQYEIGMLKKSHFDLQKQLRLENQRKQINKDIFNHIQRNRQDEIIQQIESQLYEVDRRNTKSLSWAKLILADTKYTENIERIFESLIDPRMIYFQKDVTQEQFSSFLNRLIRYLDGKQYVEKKKQIEMIQEVFCDMENQEPQIFLAVGQQYSTQGLPGYFQIPHDFNIKEMYEFYFKNRRQIVENRVQFQNMVNYIKKEKQKFNSLFKVAVKIQRAHDSLQAEQIFLFMKKLNRFAQNSENIQKVINEHDQINVSQKYKELETIEQQDKFSRKMKVLRVPLDYALNTIK